MDWIAMDSDTPSRHISIANSQNVFVGDNITCNVFVSKEQGKLEGKTLQKCKKKNAKS